ncbi:helix-turn-helix transcriptional regulator [Leptolyngbya sp. 15MV]|nr:helix-turn-helix transcriptional regulator [Leptolyngbya sp. 15MV]
MSWVAAGRLLEAVHDDDALTQVVAELATQIGARSFFGGFGLEGGLNAVVANNGWWTGEQLILYDRDFLALDPCAAAMLDNWRPQEVIDLERVIGPENFERSRLYQDFIRPMGDDTFRALGVPFEAGSGKGAITFQRGVTQARFGREEIALLSRAAPDLARLFVLRARLAGNDRAIAQRSAALDALEEALIVVNGDARLVHANRRAEDELRRACAIALHEGRVRPASRADWRAFDVMLAMAASPDCPPGHGMRLSSSDGAHVDLAAVPLLDGTVLLAFGGARSPGIADLLRTIYGLSPGEVDIAMQLWDGETVERIADRRGTSRHTVRLQVRAICDKMGCSRQVEIVSRIAALPRVGGIT